MLHFSGEELGLYGSKFYTEHPLVDVKQVNYMINMDMVGRLNDSSKVLTIGGIGTSPAWPSILKMNEQTDFTIKVDSSGTGPSDHTSFYRKDLPVLFFFTGLHTDYHKPSDDAQLINYSGTRKIVQYISRIIDQTPAAEKLAFTKTKEQQMGGGRFKVSIGIMPDYTFSGQGVKADGVIDGRPAQKAGVQAGDVIIQLGEHLITSVETYMQALNRFDKGQQTTVTIKRGNEIKEFAISF
ncbi:M28 family peptidase [Phnomibacter ginsenosidimutans]|uniref:M28 family peptidase n=1 Tax=Phnomibacter ginsenosidimutans TaxID=2676868 RepID=A0A6I6GS79_9BACT|nr:M28 family peptidase [Phnomibacter ginsenosidimutans]QGW29822.1 M28 family peptidase [Phnomibacter ginsenosidimutans]